MTKERQNLVVAKLCGWRETTIDLGDGESWICWVNGGRRHFGEQIAFEDLPTYTDNLLNAIEAVHATCSDMELFKSYVEHAKILIADDRKEPLRPSEVVESLLKAHGVWED